MKDNTFCYNYSSTRNTEVERIRKKYTPIQESKFERLKKLDLRVQNAGITESLIIGIIGALVFGVGMCFGLDALHGADWLTLVFGIAGLIIMLPAYPIYKRRARKIKAELTPEILRLSEEIINSQDNA